MDGPERSNFNCSGSRLTSDSSISSSGNWTVNEFSSDRGRRQSRRERRGRLWRCRRGVKPQTTDDDDYDDEEIEQLASGLSKRELIARASELGKVISDLVNEYSRIRRLVCSVRYKGSIVGRAIARVACNRGVVGNLNSSAAVIVRSSSGSFSSSSSSSSKDKAEKSEVKQRQCSISTKVNGGNKDVNKSCYVAGKAPGDYSCVMDEFKALLEYRRRRSELDSTGPGQEGAGCGSSAATLPDSVSPREISLARLERRRAAEQHDEPEAAITSAGSGKRRKDYQDKGADDGYPPRPSKRLHSDTADFTATAEEEKLDSDNALAIVSTARGSTLDSPQSGCSFGGDKRGELDVDEVMGSRFSEAENRALLRDICERFAARPQLDTTFMSRHRNIEGLRPSRLASHSAYMITRKHAKRLILRRYRGDPVKLATELGVQIRVAEIILARVKEGKI